MNIFGDDDTEPEDLPEFVENLSEFTERSEESFEPVRDRAYGYRGNRGSNSRIATFDEEPVDIEPMRVQRARYAEPVRVIRGDRIPSRGRRNDNVYYRNDNMYYRNNSRNRNRYSYSRNPRNDFRQTNNYLGSKPTFSKEENGAFVSNLMRVVLFALLVIFALKGDTAYSAVAGLVLVVTLLGKVKK